MTLRYACDLPHAEIAAALGCSPEAARRSLHEGLKRLERSWHEDDLERHAAPSAPRRGPARRRLRDRRLPFGPLLLATTPRGLVRVGLPNQDADELLVDLAERVSPRVLEAPAELDEVRRELDLYFEGRLRDSTCRSTGG